MQECRAQNLDSIRKRSAFMGLKLMVLLLCILGVASCKTSTESPANSSPASADTSPPASIPATQPVQPAPPMETAAMKPRIDACSLLSGTEIETVQGETVKETNLSGQSAGGFSISQCFFTLPTFTNSISLMVAQKGEGVGARDPKDFWRSTFHDEKARQKASNRTGEKGEEKEESAPAQKISGVGDEAFWMGNQISGAIYVLKGNAYIRVSIGGPANEASRKRSKTLAQKAIARL
jgi:hypothetical protein